MKVHPFLYIGEPCQILPGPTAPLYIHKGATSWELRAVKFQLSCELGRHAPVKFYVSCKAATSYVSTQAGAVKI